MRTEAAQPKRTAVLETSAAGSANSAASRSVPVSAMTVAQAIAAVEQSRSEATSESFLYRSRQHLNCLLRVVCALLSGSLLAECVGVHQYCMHNYNNQPGA